MYAVKETRTMFSRLCFLVLFCMSALGTLRAGFSFDSRKVFQGTDDDVTSKESPSQIQCNKYRKKHDVCIEFNGTSHTVVSQGEMPHMAMVSSAYLPFREGTMDRVCGGALISEHFVLTSGICGHIVQMIMEEGDVYVRLGEVQKNFLNDEETEQNTTQIIKITKIFLHPKFNDEEESHSSVGLLQLASPAHLNDFVRPACLQTGKTLGGSPLIVSDWNRGEDNTHTLRASLSKQLTNEESKEVLPRKHSLTMLCVKTPMDIRARDDGGTVLQALSAPPNCFYTIVGISGLNRCGSEKEFYKLSYTQIAPYVQWIEKIVWPKIRVAKPKPT